MLLELVTPTLDVTPGEQALGRVRLRNDEPRETSYRVRVVGIDGPTDWRPVQGGAVPVDGEILVDIPIDVPSTLGIGQHSVGIEVSSDQPRELPGLATVTLAVESVSKLRLVPDPSIIRGRRRGKFELDLENREADPIEVTLVGGSPDVQMRFKPDRVAIEAGGRAFARGRVKGPRHLSGESVQHFVTITARGRAQSHSITARYVQRSLIPWRFRRFVAVLVVLALGLGAIGGGFYWWSQRDTATTDSQTDGDQSNADGTTGSNTDGSTNADGTPAGDGGGGGGDAAVEEPVEQRRTNANFGGTITMADGGDPTGVEVRLDRISLGAEPNPDAQPVGFRQGAKPAKLWPARYGVLQQSGISSVRQTESIRSDQADGDGLWSIASVPLRQNYEVVFSKPGYNTQSFVVTPPEDGSPVAIDVELEPGDGAISGTVRAGGTALGAVDLVLSNGDVVVATTSATDAGSRGFFSFQALQTPSVYTLTASISGYGTEVVQFELGPKGTLTGQSINMVAGVGSITGQITSDLQPFGGALITATNGDETFSTTSLTVGSPGLYSLPRLPIPGEYTVTVEVNGYIAQSRRVRLGGAAANVDFTLLTETASVTGRLINIDGDPIAGAGVTITRDEITFTTATVGDEGSAAAGDTPAVTQAVAVPDASQQTRLATAVAPDQGVFSVDELEPGEYLVEIKHYKYRKYSTSITLEAGQRLVLGDIPVDLLPEGGQALGNLTLSAVDIEQFALKGVQFTVASSDPESTFVARKLPADLPPVLEDGETFVLFRDLPVGSYRVLATRAEYRSREQIVNVGTGDTEFEMTMLKLGAVTARVIDGSSADPTSLDAQLDGYLLRIWKIDNAGTRLESAVGGQVKVDPTAGTFWESSEKLAVGLYEVEIQQPPEGFSIPSQFIERVPVDSVTTNMWFEITRDSPSTIELTLKAFAYPTVAVNVHVPVPGSRAVEPLSNPNLQVALACGAGDIDPAIGTQVAVNNVDVAGKYFITRREMQETVSLGTCTLTVDDASDGSAADVYEPTIVPLTGTLRVANQNAVFDRTLNVVLLAPTPTVTGNVLWNDGRPSPLGDTDLAGAPIDSVTDAIVGFTSEQTEGSALPPEPQPLTAPLSATWSGSTFTITGQRWGATNYTITDDRFANSPGVVTLTIPPTAASLTANNGVVVTRPTVDGPYAVRLTNPDPGRLGGCITIATRNTAGLSANLSKVGLAASSPGGAPYNGVRAEPADADLSIACSGGRSFSIGTPQAGATAGYWAVEFDKTTLPDFVYGPTVVANGAKHLVEGFVPPNGTKLDFDTNLIELASLTVKVTGVPTQGGEQIPFAPTLQLTSAALPAPIVGVLTPTGTPNEYTVSIPRLPVSLQNPLGLGVEYTLSVAASGYNTAAAAVTLRIPTDPDQASYPISSTVNSTTIPVSLFAGDAAEIDVTLTSNGTIRGSVTSKPWSDQPDAAIPDGLVVKAQRMYELDGTAVSPAEPQFSLSASGVNQAADTFSFSGPEGYYAIRVEHPNYEAAFLSPTGDTVPSPSTPPSGPLYRMASGVDNNLDAPSPDPFVLELESAALDLEVFKYREIGGAPASPVTRFDLRLYRGVGTTGPQIIVNPTVGQFGDLANLALNPEEAVLAVTGSSLLLSGLTGLVPDTYTLEIRDISTLLGSEGDDLAYPVIATFTLPAGDQPADRLVAIDAIMPPLSHELTVDFMAINSLGGVDDTVANPNRLEPPGPITVDREYQPELWLDITLPGATPGTLPNDSDGTDITPPLVVSGATAPDGTRPLVDTINFERMPSGEHTIGFDLPTGYTLASGDGCTVDTGRATCDVTIGALAFDSVKVESIWLRALDVPVTVNVTPVADDYPDIELTLAAPSPTTVVPYSLTPDTKAIDGVYTFASIPPRRIAYEIAVTDPLHTQAGTLPQTILVAAGATNSVDVTMTPTKYRVKGSLFFSARGSSEQTPLPLASVSVFKGVTKLAGPEIRSDGRYEFDLVTTGDLRIEVVALDGNLPDPLFGPQSVELPGVVLGRSYDQPVTVLGNAVVSGTVAHGTIVAPNAVVTAERTVPALPALSRTTTANGNGVYRFDGTGQSNAPLENGTWQISSSLVGWGAGSTELIVTDATAQNATADIDLVGRDLALTIVAERPNRAAVLVDGVYLGPTLLAASGGVITLTEAGRTDYVLQTTKAGSFRAEFTYTLPSDVFDALPYEGSTDTILIYEAAAVDGLIRTADRNRREGDAKVWLVPSPCPALNQIPNAPGTAISASNDKADKGEFSLPASSFDALSTPFDGDTNFCLLASDKNGKDQKSSATLRVVYSAGSLQFSTSGQGGQLNIAVPVPGPYAMPVAFTPAPTLDDRDNSGGVSLDDQLTYSVTATNATVGVSLTGVELRYPATATNPTKECDELLPASNTTAAETCVLTFTYQVTAADVTAGKVTMVVGHVSAQTAAGTTTRNDPIPKLSVEILDPTGTREVGETLTYTIRANNDGLSNLSNVVVTTPLTLSPSSTKTCAAVIVGASCDLIGTYTVTAADVAAGRITANATADSTETVAATAATRVTTVVNNPLMSVSFTVAPSSPAAKNDVLSFTITARNSGTANLTGVVISPQISSSPTRTLTSVTTTCDDAAKIPLAPNASCTLTGTYTVTQPDEASGQIVYTGSVSSTEATTKTTSPVTLTVTNIKAISVEFTAEPSSPVAQNDLLSFTLRARNTGTANLTGVAISPQISSSPTRTLTIVTNTCDDAAKNPLVPGETCTLTGTYLVNNNDELAGSIAYRGSVDSNETTTQQSAPSTLTVTQNPAIVPSFTASPTSPVAKDDVLSFTITALNTGTASLTGVVISPQISSSPNRTLTIVTNTCTDAGKVPLIPGASCTLTGTYKVKQADETAGEIVYTGSVTSTQTGSQSTSSVTLTVSQPPTP